MEEKLWSLMVAIFILLVSVVLFVLGILFGDGSALMLGIGVYGGVLGMVVGIVKGILAIMTKVRKE